MTLLCLEVTLTQLSPRASARRLCLRYATGASDSLHDRRWLWLTGTCAEAPARRAGALNAELGNSEVEDGRFPLAGQELWIEKTTETRFP